jgi:hypothetical protein
MLVKERVVALPHAQLQNPLGQSVVERRTAHREKARQGHPGALPIGHGFPQRAVGVHQVCVPLHVEPPFEPVPQRLALRLGIRQARLRAQRRLACLLVVVTARAEPLAHHLARGWKALLQVAALAPAMRQAGTPNQPRFLGHLVARERLGHRAWFCQTRRAFG